jgi:hypothetical protein
MNILLEHRAPLIQFGVYQRRCQERDNASERKKDSATRRRRTGGTVKLCGLMSSKIPLNSNF